MNTNRLRRLGIGVIITIVLAAIVLSACTPAEVVATATLEQDLSPAVSDHASDYFVFQSQQEIFDAINSGQTGGEIFDQLQAESEIEIASIDNYSISRSDGATLPIRLYDPGVETKPAPLLIFVYGGGGNMDFYDPGLRHLASSTGLMVATMDYRPAPFLNSLDDVVAAIRWIVQNSSNLGVDSERIALGGVSRGANLTLSTALFLRDSGNPEEQNLIRVLYLLSGYYSPEVLSSQSMEMFGYGIDLVSYEDVERLLGEIYQDKSDYSNPLAFPMLAESLSNLPPVYVVAAGIDPVRDDSIELAARLDEAGQEYYLVMWPGVGHNAGSFLFTPITPEIETYLDAMAVYLRGVLIDRR